MHNFLEKNANYIKSIISINIFVVCFFHFYNSNYYESLVEIDHSSFSETFATTFFGFLSIFLIPILVFGLLLKIFSRYLSIFWASILSFVGVFSTESYPLRDFIFKTGEIASFSNFEIFSFPFPSISILVFLIIFALSSNIYKFNHKNILVFSILWISFCEISFFDGLMGLIFWVSYFPLMIFLDKSIVEKKNFLVYIFIIFLYLFFKFGSLNINFFKPNINQDHSYVVYHLLIYFLLPILLFWISFLIIKIDPYELIKKFTNFFILIFIENILLIIFFYYTNIDVKDYDTGIQTIFIHYYYFVPCIYFLNRSSLSFQGVSTKKNVKYYFKKSIFISFNYLLTLAIIFLYLLFNFYIFKLITN